MTTGGGGKSLERLQSMLTDEDKRAMDAYLAKECGHSSGDAGKVSSVPELPEHWNPPFLGSDLRKIRLSMSDKEWAFLAACCNAVHSPGGLKQQLSDLQQRVEELEGELEAEKSNDHWLGEDA